MAALLITYYISIITILKVGSKSECPSTWEPIMWYIYTVSNKKEQTADTHMLNLTNMLCIKSQTQKSV